MEARVLRVSETVRGTVEADKAIIWLKVISKKLIFGSAAMAASEELKLAVEQSRSVSDSVEDETESVATHSSDGLFGKSAVATYTVKLTVNDLTALGAVLGICSAGRTLSVSSINWHYEEDEEKLRLIKAATAKAKYKAEQMVAVLGYQIVGIRACSDSYQVPTMNEVKLSRMDLGAVSSAVKTRSRTVSSPVVDIGAQFQHKKKITATCSIEFWVDGDTEVSTDV